MSGLSRQMYLHVYCFPCLAFGSSISFAFLFSFTFFYLYLYFLFFIFASPNFFGLKRSDGM